MSAQFLVCQKHTIDCQHVRGFPGSTASSQDAKLRLAVKQYTPRGEPHPSRNSSNFNSVTVIAAHAVGMVKELYEPLFDELLKVSHVDDSYWRIRSIWIADVSTHGESGVLNEGQLGVDVSWDDHARDLLHMVNVFRDEMPQPIVGIGHSMGGQNILQLALLHPSLFAAVIPIEAIVNKHHALNFSAAYGMTYQRDLWPSREEAFASTSRAAWRRTWDNRVLARWKQYGFRELPTVLYQEASPDVASKAAANGTAPVTLSTSKHQEAHALTRQAYPAPGNPLDSFKPEPPFHTDLTKAEHSQMQAPFYRPEAVLTFRQLSVLKPPCLYIWGGKSVFVSAKPESRADKLRVTGTAPGGSGGQEAGLVKEVVLNGEGHFVPFDNPALVAGQAGRWLDKMIQRWQQQQLMRLKTRSGRDGRELAMLDEDWKYWAKTWYGAKAAKQKPSSSAESKSKI